MSRGLSDMARTAGLKEKPLYSVSEVSKASGVPVQTLHDEMSAGRLTYFLPEGRIRGALIMPEWFDEWFEAGVRKGGTDA